MKECERKREKVRKKYDEILKFRKKERRKIERIKSVVYIKHLRKRKINCCDLRDVFFKEVNPNCLLVVLSEVSFAISLYHARFTNSSVPHNYNLKEKNQNKQ